MPASELHTSANTLEGPATNRGAGAIYPPTEKQGLFMLPWKETLKEYACKCGNIWQQYSRCNCPKRCPECGSKAKMWRKVQEPHA